MLYFEDEETDALVHQLAAERGVSAEEAIRIAVINLLASLDSNAE